MVWRWHSEQHKVEGYLEEMCFEGKRMLGKQELGQCSKCKGEHERRCKLKKGEGYEEKSKEDLEECRGRE